MSRSRNFTMTGLQLAQGLFIAFWIGFGIGAFVIAASLVLR